ncbi:MAG: hypothetical protein V3V41_07965 [Candidatus Heimdallarchaeota archaeon]
MTNQLKPKWLPCWICGHQKHLSRCENKESKYGTICNCMRFNEERLR